MGFIDIVRLMIQKGAEEDPPIQFNWNYGMRKAFCGGDAYYGEDGKIVEGDKIVNIERLEIMQLMINKGITATLPKKFDWELIKTTNNSNIYKKALFENVDNLKNYKAYCVETNGVKLINKLY
jgi:hypothetical protein